MIIKRSEAILGAIASVVTTVGCSLVRQRDSKRKKLLRIYVLGDSLALGLGAERPEDGFIFRAAMPLREAYSLALCDIAVIVSQRVVYERAALVG